MSSEWVTPSDLSVGDIVDLPFGDGVSRVRIVAIDPKTRHIRFEPWESME